MGKKTLFGKKISVVLLSLMMGMSNVGVTAYAEEASPVTETGDTQSTAEPTSTVSADDATEKSAQPEASAPAETANPSAPPKAVSTASPTAMPTASPTAPASAETTVAPAPSASAKAEEALIDVSKPTVDAEESSVYYAKDIVDYVAALSSVRSTADNKLIVHSFDDISDCIQNGKALYFDGTYIVVFDSADDLAASKKAVSDKLGDVVFDDEAITVDIGNDDGKRLPM